MGGGEIAAILSAAMAVLIAKFVFVVGVVVLLVTRTAAGRRMFGLRRVREDESSLPAVTDHLQSLQGQLDDVHARLDFAERVMVEQREQLRALGAPEPRAELRELTPV